MKHTEMSIDIYSTPKRTRFKMADKLKSIKTTENKKYC